jgi:metal-responsive CopG/Arc/MetJ family transcriptional regulator
MPLERYTLSLPAELYGELKELAEHRGVSTNEMVRQCLKFGLVAMKIDGDPNAELFIRETQGNGSGFRDTRLVFI